MTDFNERIGLCPTCVNYVPHFKMCLDRPIFVFDLFEDADKHECQRGYTKTDTQSPYKQLSKKMWDSLEKTHFEFEFDSDGWIRDVHVKGMEKKPTEIPIPKDILMFSFYNHAVISQMGYGVKPDGQAILVASSLTTPSMFTVLKRWNNASEKPAVITVPKQIQMLSRVIDVIESHPSHNMLLERIERDGFEKMRDYWVAMGYQGGEYSANGIIIPYVAYKMSDNYNMVIIPYGSVDDAYSIITENVQLTETQDKVLFEKLGLETRCPLCGFDNGRYAISQPCEWCHRDSYPVVFKM